MENQHVSVTRFFREQRVLLASLLLFGLFLVELALLHRFTLYDLMVYDWMQEYRSCALDRVASFLKYWTTKPYLTVALILFVAGWLAYRRRWRELSCFTVIAIGGALLSEWVKEFVSRPRPSALSFSDYGTSFPSGHVTSAATIFGAAYYFLGEPCVGQWWRRYLATAGVVGLVLVIAFQRVYFTHHWLSDVVGGALLGTGWLFFAIDRFSRGVNWRSIIAGAALFAGAFLALRLLPLFRVNDPSPMAWRGDPAGLVDLSAYAPNTIERRVRRLRMGRAPQTIWHFFKPTTTVDLPLARSGEYYLMFAARPRVAFESAGCRNRPGAQ